MSQDPDAIVRRWFDEVWNQRRLETIDELMTSDSICYADGGSITGPDEFKDRQYAPFVAMFPDLRIEVEATLARADQVVVRWTATATHTGDGLGMRATGEPIVFQGMTWIRTRDGKLVEGWQRTNIPDVLRLLSSKSPS